MCPAMISGIVTEHAQVSYQPMFFRKSSNKNDRDQVLRARETEHPTQTLVFTKNSKMPNLVEVIVIQGLPVFQLSLVIVPEFNAKVTSSQFSSRL